MNVADAMYTRPTLRPFWISAPERIRHVTPEKRLMVAILEEALLTLKKRGPRRKDFREALEWLTSEETAGPFSYRNICDILELDADQIRHRFVTDEPSPRAASTS
jgi:hypothetical protein